ncbi:hypothetical protein LTR16_010211, partial [Cryomyces antarcticus]
RLGTDLEREDLASDDPGDWSPRAGEEEDVDADECDQCTLTRQVVETHTRAYTSNDELASRHSDSTEEE